MSDRWARRKYGKLAWWVYAARSFCSWWEPSELILNQAQLAPILPPWKHAGGMLLSIPSRDSSWQNACFKLCRHSCEVWPCLLASRSKDSQLRSWFIYASFMFSIESLVKQGSNNMIYHNKQQGSLFIWFIFSPPKIPLFLGIWYQPFLPFSTPWPLLGDRFYRD